MSDESPPPAESSTNPTADGAPRVRRISNPRPKKTTKSARPERSPQAPPVAAPDADSAPKTKSFPEFPSTGEEPTIAVMEESPARNDWPEPEPASSGTVSTPENPKRKRRRKKGKGGSQPQNSSPQAEAESPDEPAESAPPQNAPQTQHPRPAHPPRVKLDAELLAKFAWKIYLSEVSEEGVALIGDNDAKELTRRCFRLAEIFLEEQARRR